MTAGRWIPLLMALALVGCVSAPTVPMAPSASDTEAKKFTPPAGKANLYVARSSSTTGGIELFDISVDGRVIGQIAPGTFYLVAIDPGKHEVSASSRMNAEKVTLNADAGRNYFYELTATSSGFTAKPSLGLVLIEEMGKLMVRQVNRAQASGE